MKFIDWLDERLAVRELIKVMLTEYYVPKKY
jgi:ubiquinol-cytochrome c reductase cytochrome b subunit